MPTSARHRSLNFNGTAYRVDGADKLDRHAITGRPNNLAPMGGYSGATRAYLSALSRANVPSSSEHDDISGERIKTKTFLHQ